MAGQRAVFDKPALTLDEQVDLLEARGLIIENRERVRHYLEFIGYYRLSGYFRYYYGNPGGENPDFREHTTFNNVLDLYIFDRQLRNLLMDALERIEVAAKASISNIAATERGDPFWITNASNFDRGRHNVIMAMIDDVVRNGGQGGRYEFISHYYKKYHSPSYPPSWMLMEVLSFASISKIYKFLKGDIRVAVAGKFGLQQDVLESWLHALSFVRNVSAHHSRTWNKTLTIAPKIPRKHRGEWPIESQAKVYSACSMIHCLMEVIADGSQWSERLQTLINGRPDVPLSAMGFPDDWEARNFWGRLNAPPVKP